MKGLKLDKRQRRCESRDDGQNSCRYRDSKRERPICSLPHCNSPRAALDAKKPKLSWQNQSIEDRLCYALTCALGRLPAQGAIGTAHTATSTALAELNESWLARGTAPVTKPNAKNLRLGVPPISTLGWLEIGIECGVKPAPFGPLWVTSGHFAESEQCPLYPQ